MPTLDAEGGLIVDVGTAVPPIAGEQLGQLQTKTYETLSSSDVDSLTIGTGSSPSFIIQRVVGGSTVGSWEWTMDSSNNLLLNRVTGTGIYVWNDVGASVDFRMESNTDAELFFLDGSTDRIGISTTSPATTLDVQGALTVNGILSQDDTTNSTSGTTGSIHTDGGLGVLLDIAAGNDLLLVSSGAVINFALGM
ncbi:hypothetical protein LCGC14_2989650 [marine sediment metagenome]|uniref:Uncharacterized protein n=1 Tax=marine sediment metagenome TaxID=412755 RepID=A0A0F8X504_9ZZZZ